MSFLASPLPPGMIQFCDSNGIPLAGGSVSHYVPASLTPKTTWADENQAVANPTTITLDAAGRAIIFGSGDYRQIVKDKNAVTIWDQVTNCSVGSSGAAPGVFTTISTTGNVTQAAWTTNGLRLSLATAVYTDQTSIGTVPSVYIDAHKAVTLATANIVTYTNAYTAYFENPIAGVNATITNAWALGADSADIVGNMQVGGALTVGGPVAFTGGVSFSNSNLNQFGTNKFTQVAAVSGTWYTVITNVVLAATDTPSMWLVQVTCDNTLSAVYLLDVPTSVVPIITPIQLQPGTFAAGQIDGGGDFQAKQTSGVARTVVVTWTKFAAH